MTGMEKSVANVRPAVFDILTRTCRRREPAIQYERVHNVSRLQVSRMTIHRQKLQVRTILVLAHPQPPGD